jgi:hypothetical protein
MRFSFARYEVKLADPFGSHWELGRQIHESTIRVSTMGKSDKPRPYEEWRKQAVDRAEDAAYTFGFHLMQYCRAEALKSAESEKLPANSNELSALLTKAVDSALNNLTDLLEGFFKLYTGTNHEVEYVLTVCVKDKQGHEVERVDISPCMLDLPIGYWKWADGEFR